MKPIRLLVNGAGGRMGQAVVRLALADTRFALVAAVSRTAGAMSSGMPVLPAAQLPEVSEFDVAIDFSLPDGLEALRDLCCARGAALVSGTTGLSAAQRDAFHQAAARIPLLWAPNFSLGVTVLGALVRRAAAALPHWDADIVELHHSAKRDAPSGTALALGEALASSRGAPPSFHSLRAGDAVGEHCVQLSGRGERLELIHRATDRDVFARGALFAAHWLAAQPAGGYSLEDALGPVLTRD